MMDTFWRLVVDNQQRSEDLRLEETAVLLYEVAVRTKLNHGPLPGTVALVRIEGPQETVVLATKVHASVS